jgi:hypothetical protein
MAANMIFDHLSHQPIHRTANGGDDLKHVGTTDLCLKGAFDCFNLPDFPKSERMIAKRAE